MVKNKKDIQWVKTRQIQIDFGFVFDLSEPGKYRVVVNVGKDDRFANSYTVSREFSVK